MNNLVFSLVHLKFVIQNSFKYIGSGSPTFKEHEPP